MKKLLLTLSLITVMSLMAQAQNFTASISSVVNSAQSGTAILAPFTTDAHLEFGLVTDPVTFTVKTNRTWKMMTSISNIAGVAIGGGPASIIAPLQPLNISWGVINGAAGTVSAWNIFANATTTSTAAVQAKTGPRGAPAVEGNTFTLQYKVIPGFEVDPGTYTVTVVNTISAQ